MMTLKELKAILGKYDSFYDDFKVVIPLTIPKTVGPTNVNIDWVALGIDFNSGRILLHPSKPLTFTSPLKRKEDTSPGSGDTVGS